MKLGCAIFCVLLGGCYEWHNVGEEDECLPGIGRYQVTSEIVDFELELTRCEPYVCCAVDGVERSCYVGHGELGVIEPAGADSFTTSSSCVGRDAVVMRGDERRDATVRYLGP